MGLATKNRALFKKGILVKGTNYEIDDKGAIVGDVDPAHLDLLDALGFKDPAKEPPKKPVKLTEEQKEEVDLEMLRSELESYGGKADKRWKEERLREEIVKAQEKAEKEVAEATEV